MVLDIKNVLGIDGFSFGLKVNNDQVIFDIFFQQKQLFGSKVYNHYID